jgi:cystathionine beta-synthase
VSLSADAQRNVHENILGTIGRTPLVRLNRVARGLSCELFAKLEQFNPGGSVKDRIGLPILEAYEQQGKLRPGGTVVEATSGNTGVGLAIACALKGYQAVFVMPDKMSEEKRRLLRAFGARVIITPTAVEPDDPRSYYSVARRLVEETPNAVLANQYHNPVNPQSHYISTAPEIWEQTSGRVTDIVVAMGTGGTISGIARWMRDQGHPVRIIGVDPVGSILAEAWKRGGDIQGLTAYPYKVEGFGEDFIPSTLDLSLIDDVVVVDDAESFVWTRRLVREEGIFCGGSSGAALAGARRTRPSGRSARWWCCSRIREPATSRKSSMMTGCASTDSWSSIVIGRRPCRSLRRAACRRWSRPTQATKSAPWSAGCAPMPSPSSRS